MKRRSFLSLLALAALLAFLPAADRPSPSPSPATPPRRPVAAWSALVAKRPGPHPLADSRGRVPVIVPLAPGRRAADDDLLEVAPGLGAQWVPQGDLDGFIRSHEARRPWVSPPLRPLLSHSVPVATRAAEAHRAGVRGKGVLVGIIDTGLDVTHPDLRNADGSTRVAWMLDLARPPLGKHPKEEAAFGCTADKQAPCAVLNGEDIDAEIRSASPLVSRDVVGHGTHVASIAAGNGGKEKTYTGMAPDATLVVVRVTRASGSSITDVDVLNAVRFVFDRADVLQVPAVVNLSLGSDFGPHDGTSPLETGLASQIGPEKPGRVIVVAAGNSGGLCINQEGFVFGSHTEARVLPHSTVRLPLRTPFFRGTIQGSVYLWLNFGPGDDLAVGVERNGNTLVSPLASGQEGAVSDASDGRVYAGIINGVVGNGSPIEVGSSGAVVVLDGSWPSSDEFAVVLEGQGTAQAWVQGLSEAEQIGCGGTLFPKSLKQGTINVPASHPNLLAVGCSLNRLGWKDEKGTEVAIDQVGSLRDPPPDSLCYFSSAGPNALGVPKPEITAPGGFVAAAMSRDARPGVSASSLFADTSGVCPDGTSCTVVDATHAVASGTSMSAPHVTGAVALLLERERTLTQGEVTALLQGGSRPFTGIVPYEFQGGPGALDVPGAFAALAERGLPRHLTPVASKSWLQVSAEFARPDGQSPVVGTVILHAADGGPADGFTPNPLLAVENATISAPLARQGPGVWKFSVVAPPGTGGKNMSLAVTYDGVVLGQRKNLPISADVWGLEGPAPLRGGCAVQRTLPASRDRMLFVTTWLLVIGLRRRHRHRLRSSRLL